MKKKATPGQLKYWSRKVRNAGFVLDTNKRELDVTPFTQFKDIPVGPRYYVGQLIRAGYNVQLKIQ